ncbi:hypothetical protein AU476_31250 [Cupriavidus sp. UYMSc13B]|nr:hypothetical protein AU476_31250 [Cupriavidus sp. UYMSc13B]
MTEAEIRALMAAFGSAFRAGDADGVAACLADDFTWRLPTGTGDPQGDVLHGKEAVRRYLRERFAPGSSAVTFSDSRMEILGDVVLLQYRVRGTADDGRPVDAQGLDLFRVVDGKVRLKDAYWKQVAWPGQRHNPEHHA